ncbi:MAG: gamma carbonic anhydrase family protein [Promethearchaeota archaeon]
MIIKSPINGKIPKIHPTAFIAEDVVIIGDVEIQENVNIWYGAKIRGDMCKIVIGKNTSVQENVVIHSEPGTECIIGENIIIGHMAMVHGPCEIGNNSMVGIGATVLQGSKMGRGCVLAAGSVLRGNMEDYSLYAGVPAGFKKNYGEKRMELGRKAAENYMKTGQAFKQAGLNQLIDDKYLAPH